MRKPFQIFSCILPLVFLTGCSTVINSHRQKEDMMENYLAGKNGEVREKLKDKLDGSLSSAVGSGDEVMWRLEAGGFCFLTGNDSESFTQFTIAENLMADFDARAIVNIRAAAAEGTMLVTNPNAVPYRGLCRDRVLFPVYKALACLGMNKEEDFRVELFHLREVQDKVISDYSSYFEEEKKAAESEKEHNKDAASNADPEKVLADARNKETAEALDAVKNVANRGYGNFLNPFTIFMSGYGYLRDGNLENAIVDFERLYKALPEHPLIQQYYVTILRKTNRSVPEKLKDVQSIDFPLDRDNILVIFAKGRSAAFKQIHLYIPVFYAGFFTLATIAWPLCEYYDSPFQNLTVSAGGKEYTTLPVADMDGILSQEYRDRLPGMLTRIILSTAAKEIASYIAIKAAGSQSSGAGIAVALASAAYKAVFNTADTRSWEILPKEYQIIQLPMPEDRKLSFSLPGMAAWNITVPEQAKSAVLFVNAPSVQKNAVTYRLLELHSK